MPSCSGGKEIFMLGASYHDTFLSIEFKLKLVYSDAICFQLTDLEDCRNDLEEDEYEEMRRDTIAQLSEFETSLAKMTSGMSIIVI